MNVRQTEKLVQAGRNAGGGSAKQRAQAGKDADTLALERDLTNRLGLTVSINQKGQGGDIVVSYRTLEQLDDILARLSTDPDGYDEDLDDPFAKEELDEDEMRALLEEAEDDGEPATSELDLIASDKPGDDGALGQMGWKAGDRSVADGGGDGSKSDAIISGSGWKNTDSASA
jgi:hypothetical protein